MAKKITVTLQDLRAADAQYEAEQAEKKRLREEERKEMLEKIIDGINKQLKSFKELVREKGLKEAIKQERHVAICKIYGTKFHFAAREFIDDLNETLKPAGFEAKVGNHENNIVVIIMPSKTQ